MPDRVKRETLTLIRPAPAPAVRRLEWETDWHYAARCRAIAALGPRWVRHPAYKPDPRHSVNPSIWKPARAAFLAEIARRAAADRARNPVFQLAERVRRAVEG